MMKNGTGNNFDDSLLSYLQKHFYRASLTYGLWRNLETIIPKIISFPSRYLKHCLTRVWLGELAVYSGHSCASELSICNLSRRVSALQISSKVSCKRVLLVCPPVLQRGWVRMGRGRQRLRLSVFIPLKIGFILE